MVLASRNYFLSFQTCHLNGCYSCRSFELQPKSGGGVRGVCLVGACALDLCSKTLCSKTLKREVLQIRGVKCTLFSHELRNSTYRRTMCFTEENMLNGWNPRCQAEMICCIRRVVAKPFILRMGLGIEIFGIGKVWATAQLAFRVLSVGFFGVFSGR